MVLQIDSEIKKINAKLMKINEELEKLDDSISATDEGVMDIYGFEKKLEDKFEHLEEELATIKTENLKLKEQLDSIIKQLPY